MRLIMVFTCVFIFIIAVFMISGFILVHSFVVNVMKPLTAVKNKTKIELIGRNDCDKFYNIDVCRSVSFCLASSKDISFTNEQLSEYDIDVDYSKLAYKTDGSDLPIYYLWHPDEIVYVKNTKKRQANNRNKMENFQVIQTVIAQCYARNGLSLQKILNSYKPQN